MWKIHLYEHAYILNMWKDIISWYTLYTNIKNYKTLSIFSCFFFNFSAVQCIPKKNCTLWKLYNCVCVCVFHKKKEFLLFFSIKNKPVKNYVFLVYHTFFCCLLYFYVVVGIIIHTMLVVCLYKIFTKMCVSNKECITCDSHVFFMMHNNTF